MAGWHTPGTQVGIFFPQGMMLLFTVESIFSDCTWLDGSSRDGDYPSTTSMADSIEQVRDMVFDVGPPEPPHVRSGDES